MEKLRITEIFHSLQGESSLTGLPTVFVRLTGCPLRCNYCDTEYAFTGGTRMAMSEILAEIAQYNCSNVCVTGGEPLSQKACLTLLRELCDKSYQVSLETSGALDISKVDDRVIKVMDLKTPASGEMSRNLMTNLTHMDSTDQLKFVICSRQDYDWAKMQIETNNVSAIGEILFSPSYAEVQPTELATWILEDKLQVRMQIQLHKLLWGDKQGV
ncbi:MAG: 7-carboxy-7-deazaguanine synthase QueE [Gammaproteobacteria bacterium]|nr:7-carboxy-7-deazaguanine synthase QueE [Gammaproteobacteria bacterium]NNJ73249.1 7-carboxy-7-deazaguanine synthase QueE [Enterobacterales bacterium]